MIKITVDTGKALAKLKADHAKEVKKQMKGELKTLTSELAEATPIDTGYARSRWRLIVDTDRLYPFKIVNDAPYIQKLNGGYSKQAPSYFIERTVLRRATPVGSIVEQTRPDL